MDSRPIWRSSHCPNLKQFKHQNKWQLQSYNIYEENKNLCVYTDIKEYITTCGIRKSCTSQKSYEEMYKYLLIKLTADAINFILTKIKINIISGVKISIVCLPISITVRLQHHLWGFMKDIYKPWRNIRQTQLEVQSKWPILLTNIKVRKD